MFVLLEGVLDYLVSVPQNLSVKDHDGTRDMHSQTVVAHAAGRGMDALEAVAAQDTDALACLLKECEVHLGPVARLSDVLGREVVDHLLNAC